MQAYKKEPLRTVFWLLFGLAVVVFISLWVASKTGAQLLAPGLYDSYTKQAMAWRSGHVSLGQDYPWLELVILNGDYYVSFPPTPSVPLFFLSFIFGEQIPSGLVTLLYMLGGFTALFFLARRYLAPGQAMACAVFAALGGSLLDISVSGGNFSGAVWYQAQLLAFLLTSLAFLLMDGDRRGGWVASLIFIALAVGCRPFNALYVPFLLWLLYGKINKGSFWARIRAMIPYIIIPALIACLYGLYNYVRFGNPLEFGHALLPEYEQAGEPAFALRYFPRNLRNLFVPPSIVDGRLTFPVVCGFAIYLTSPMLTLTLYRVAERGIRRDGDVTDLFLTLTLVLQVLLFMTHRTFGTWQYGTRYISDLLPPLMLLYVRGCLPLRRWETFAMGALMLFNIYGTIQFHFM